MPISIMSLVAFVVLVAAVVALSVSKSRMWDTVLFSVFYTASTVAVTSIVVEFLSRLS